MTKELVVIKVGTSTIMDEANNIVNIVNMAKLVTTIYHLRAQGFHVVVVTSGAVGFGRKHLNLKEKPNSLQLKQALACTGQCTLMHMYSQLFQVLDLKIAQVLMTHSDFLIYDNFTNIKNTIQTLLEMDITPIINENDGVNIEEIKFGDNDTLSGEIAILMSAHYLFLLSDIDCLYTHNPRLPLKCPNLPIGIVGRAEHFEEDNKQYFQSHFPDLAYGDSSLGSSVGTGGMITKLRAARRCVQKGITVILLNGSNPERILEFSSKKSELTELLGEKNGGEETKAGGEKGRRDETRGAGKEKEDSTEGEEEEEKRGKDGKRSRGEILEEGDKAMKEILQHFSSSQCEMQQAFSQLPFPGTIFLPSSVPSIPVTEA